MQRTRHVAECLKGKKKMALAYDNTVQSSALMARIGFALRGFGESIIKAHQFRITVRELSALSSRELADLGLDRSNIISVAHESVYGV